MGQEHEDDDLDLELENEELEDEDLEDEEPDDEESDDEESDDEESDDEESDDDEPRRKKAAEVDNESVQRAINKQHRRFREEERKRQDLEEQLRDTQAKLAKFTQTEQEIVIPPIPDPWDENYDQLVAQREEAIVKRTQVAAQRQAEEDRLQREAQSAKVQAEETRQKTLQGYAERAKKAGIKIEDLVVASNVVADARVSQPVAEFLLTDPDGPLITAYLADDANTVELYELAGLNPVSAGMKMIELREKARSLFGKPKKKAPKPPRVVTGRKKGSASERPLISNAKFE
jgi:hypothetical protein